AEDKAKGAPGFIGLETAFPVCYTVLVKQGSLQLSTLSAIMSYNPARILGLPDRGLLQPGLQADLVLVDLGKKETIGERPFVSRSWNSPFAGLSLEGSILLTIHRGKIVYQRGS
ncbi:MAG: amidohydrolase family protein, partial [Breznakiellaceae bacterium]